MKPTFSIAIRVYYEDTDAGGVVYYANYLKFMERARSEWLRALGFEQDELSRHDRVLFAVRSVTLEFLKPARFNDFLQVSAVVQRQGKASITFAQAVSRDADMLCQGEIKVACVDAGDFTPRPLPSRLTGRLFEATANV